VAIFGMKDYQQAIVLKQMTADLGYPIQFIIAPTIRERDGVAMSSRNKYFDKTQRKAARCLYYALHTAMDMVHDGFKNCGTIEAEMRAVIKSISPTAKIEYIAFTESDTLKPLKKIKPGCVCSLAVVVHGVRLIDNWRF
jgi:pantoate--beta-alanine ligase